MAFHGIDKESSLTSLETRIPDVSDLIRIITHLLMQPWDLDAGRRSAWCSTTAIYKNWIANHKSQPNLISSAPFWHCIFRHPSDFEQNGMQCREKRKAPKDISVASNPFPENPWKRDRAHTLGQRHVRSVTQKINWSQHNLHNPSRIDLLHKILLTQIEVKTLFQTIKFFRGSGQNYYNAVSESSQCPPRTSTTDSAWCGICSWWARRVISLMCSHCKSNITPTALHHLPPLRKT